MRCRLLAALAAAALLADAAHARSLLQGGGSGGGGGSTPSTAPGGTPTSAAGAAMSQMMTALGMGNMMDVLVFDSLQSAFLTQEYITIIDTSVSLDTFTDTSTKTVTVTPGDFWEDLGTGIALQLGVSGLFYVNTAANLNGSIPKVGSQIPIVSVAGKVNVPARRRLLTTAEAAAEAAAAPPPAADAPPADAHVELPRRVAADVSPAALAGLTQAGFWDNFAAILPPSLRANLTTLLAAQSRPAAEFLSRYNVSSDDVDALARAFGAHGLNFTLQQPQFPNPLQTTAIPFFDLQFSFTLLDQANQAGANVRVTPYALRVGANGQIFQSVKVVPYLAAFAQTTKQQLASQGALALNATAGLLQGDTAPATAFEQATAMIIKMQASPLPTALTISFDIFIRAQLQVNGGDIATVL